MPPGGNLHLERRGTVVSQVKFTVQVVVTAVLEH
jgi:hypothetical protein